jgi:hypothetical protein
MHAHTRCYHIHSQQRKCEAYSREGKSPPGSAPQSVLKPHIVFSKEV